MSDDIFSATTQYRDYGGNIAIDRNDLKDPFYGLAKDNGIDLERYFLVGIEFSHIKTNQKVIFYLTEAVSNADELNKYISTNETLPVIRIIKDISIDTLLKYVKRFSFVYSYDKNLIGKRLRYEV